jgi:hypothetical protein
VSEAQISRWVDDAYLYQVLPRVYGVGHRAPSVEADLMAATLFAGPGAMLSHGSAAWWWRLTSRRQRVIEVGSPRRCRSRPGIRVHGQRSLDRIWLNGIPVSTIAQTLLDVAATEPLDTVRYMLAEAEYRRLLNFDALERIMGRGKPGTKKLRRAIETHHPALARTRSRVERAFLDLCDSAGLPRPLVNVKLHGFTVDCYWPQFRLVVELDGALGHSTERQVARDHGRDLKLRTFGIASRRYAEPQVVDQGEMVIADLVSAMGLDEAA